MLHLVFHRLRSLQRSPQKALAMQLFQRLSQNPDFDETQRVAKSPILAPLKDVLPTAWMPLREVVLYSSELAPLQYAFCMQVQVTNATGSILAAILDKVAAAAQFHASREKLSWQHALRAMVQCMQDKRRAEVAPTFCRSQNDMAQPSFFQLAPDPDTFDTLLPFCDVSKALESDGSSVLHLAAQKNWSQSIKAVLRLKKKQLPNINGRRTAKRSQGSNYEFMTASNMTPLHDAVKSKCIPCTQDLLDAGAATNLTAELSASAGLTFMLPGEDASDGFEENYGILRNLSPLHLAAAYACLGCVRSLLDNHAGINAESILTDHEESWDDSYAIRAAKSLVRCDLDLISLVRAADVLGCG